MKLSLAVLALAAGAQCNSWFSNTVYNKWHETELERWLSDHDIPYPTPADRKLLENLVKDNWEGYVVKPYNQWDAQQLHSYLTTQGKEVKKGTEKNKNALVEQVQGYWHETTEQASESYSSVEKWIFDTWTESQLKSFLDYHGIPNPTPRTRDSLLQTARANYQSVANKVGEMSNYPGEWIYQSWSESDLKAWLDERGVPAPQPSNRDKLIASVRRNSRVAANSQAEAQRKLSEMLFDSWSESKLKEFCDKNGVKVPQGSNRNELVALARKHSAQLTGNNVKGTAVSAYGAATSSAGNYYAQASSGAYSMIQQYYDMAMHQIGLASADAQKSLSSVSSVVSVEASKSSVIASVEASKSSVVASRSAESASKSGFESASSASSAASAKSKSARDEL